MNSAFRNLTLRITACALSLAFASGLLLTTTAAYAATEVPAGNRNAEQPAVPGASQRRTRAKKTSFDKKYEKVLALLQSDQKLQDRIRKSAKAYGIDPIHITGALVGEHTYNVDVLDRLQTYYVKARSYGNEEFRFEHDGETIRTFLKREQFEKCDDLDGSVSLWTCREAVFNEEFRGKRVDGNDYPEDRFSRVFFQPFLAGQTFGLGQVNPLTALKVSDRVRKVSGGRRLNENRAADLYRAIMRPDDSLNFVAAIIAQAIDDYKALADFDISGNPGLTATLYNLGDSRARAAALAAENKKRKASGKKAKLPQENYYGWLVNDRIEDLEAIFGSGS
ncbi:MAG: DUF1402 family protein [Pseudomonadota bacterium]